MSEAQLSALLAKLKDDAGLQEKLRSAGDADAVIALAKEAGFYVSMADCPKYQAEQPFELSNGELEGVGPRARMLEGGKTQRNIWCQSPEPTL